MIAYDRDSERVPVEYRFLGLDKRTFAAAAAVIAVFLVFSVVIPRVNDAIPWNDPVLAGNELAVTDSVVFTPAVGWNVEAGHRLNADGSVAQSGDAIVAGDGVVVEVTSGEFDGTLTDLLSQIEKTTVATVDPEFRVRGKASTTRTDSGEVGVLQAYSSRRTDGVIAVFVIDGVGVEVNAHGSPAQMRASAPQITQMITSIRSLETKDAV